MNNFRESFTVIPSSVETIDSKTVKEAKRNYFSNKKDSAYPVFMIDVSGTRYLSRNNRKYSEETFIDYAKDQYGVWSGIRSAIHNKGIPLLKNHLDAAYPGMPEPSEVYGRVLRSEYLQDQDSEGVVRFFIEIYDEEIIQGMRSGKIADFSISGVFEKATCSICGEEYCDHVPGYYYDKAGNIFDKVPSGKRVNFAYKEIGRIWFHEISIVNVPGYAFTSVVGEVGAHSNTETKESKILDNAFVGQKFNDKNIPIVTLDYKENNEMADTKKEKVLSEALEETEAIEEETQELQDSVDNTENDIEEKKAKAPFVNYSEINAKFLESIDLKFDSLTSEVNKLNTTFEKYIAKKENDAKKAKKESIEDSIEDVDEIEENKLEETIETTTEEESKNISENADTKSEDTLSNIKDNAEEKNININEVPKITKESVVVEENLINETTNDIGAPRSMIIGGSLIKF